MEGRRQRNNENEDPTRMPRLKERRALALTQRHELAVQGAAEEQARHRWLRYHGRWHHVRVFYALVSESILGEGPRRLWARRFAAEFHRALATTRVSFPQCEAALGAVLRTSESSKTTWTTATRSLVPVFQCLQRSEAPEIDVRELICPLIILDRWEDGALKILGLCATEFSVAIDAIGTMGVRAGDFGLLLRTFCAGSDDERRIEPHVRRLEALAAASKTRAIAESELQAIVRGPPPSDLLDLLTALCWQRLTDDMRLGFYRDVYRRAVDRVEHEATRVRLQAAMHVWRLREPRLRLARWKIFVANCRLRKRGDAWYRRSSARKLVAAMARNHARRQEMQRLRQRAREAYEHALVRWTWGGWRVFVQCLQWLHEAAWRRSVRHWERVLLERMWRGYWAFVLVGRQTRAARQARVDAFVARREWKELKRHWHEWQYFHRRRLEIRDAERRERALHWDLYELRQQETDTRLMGIEDTISQAVEVKERALVEEARRRAFQAASERVYEIRKLRQQEEERARFKREREEQAAREMEVAWVRIREKVSAEVRASTLTWFTGAEGQAAVHEEATRIFERDPIVLQKALLADPTAYGVPGCCWQLRLEDYGGRFAKAFYLNVETLEKLVCDELVMDNCEEIAREVLIQRRIDDARARVEARAAAVARERLEHQAALRIQGLFRCRHARVLVRSRIRAHFVKRIEPHTGDAVYFSIPRQEARRRPPRLIGPDEPLIPVESSTWVHRLDDDGRHYYQHLGTLETSWAPPAHHLLCVRCRVNFATRRWNERGGRYCIVCYAEGLRRGEFGADATWTKLTVQAAKCAVCRNAPAEVVCHECRGDVSCRRCCAAVHQNPKLRAHTQMDTLVYTT